MLVCLFTLVFFIHYLRTVEIYFFYTIGMSGHCYFNCMLCFNDVSYVQTHILFIFVYKHVYVLQYIVSVYIQIQCFVVCNGTTAIPYQALIFSQLHKTVNTMVHVLRYTLLLIHVLSGTSLHRIVWCSFIPTCTFINESDQLVVAGVENEKYYNEITLCKSTFTLWKFGCSQKWFISISVVFPVILAVCYIFFIFMMFSDKIGD